LGEDALAVLADVFAGDPDFPERSAAILLRETIRAQLEDARGAALAMRDEADRIRGRDDALEFALLSEAAVAAMLGADVPLCLALASRAADAARDEGRRTMARALRGYAAVHRGDGGDADAIAAMEQLGALDPDALGDDALTLLQLAGWVLMVRERRDEAERVLRGLTRSALRRGHTTAQAFASVVLAEIGFRRGRWLDALTDATFDIALRESRAVSRGTLGFAVAAHVFAHLGERAHCEQRAAQALAYAERVGLWSIAAFARAALGASALAHGDAAGALAELRRVWEIRQRGGVASANVVWYHGDFVEALLATRDLALAAEVVDEVGREADATGLAWPRAVAARGRALLGQGAPEDAIAAAVAADAPFELARTRLVLVEHGRLGAEAAGLRDALQTFERLGARPWAARARDRLGARGESPPSLAQLLTDAELRVAMLVGRGATNAAAGEQLVISVRTVDAHLRSIFRKLGIKSRSELVLRVATEGGRR
ncbi:MAG: hypothetical protein DCC71_11775, partial [Proteobacteria bacterium]